MTAAVSLLSTANATEYLGSSFTLDKEQGYALLTFHAFRSEAKGEEAFEFFLELYSEQPVRRLIYDVRTALWPMDKRSLKRRFRRHGARMPRSVIAVVCEDVSHPAMMIGKEAYEAAGHIVHLTMSEADAIAFVTRYGPNAPQDNPTSGRAASAALWAPLRTARTIWRRFFHLFGAA
jgi:hypothetical protein